MGFVGQRDHLSVVDMLGLTLRAFEIEQEIELYPYVLCDRSLFDLEAGMAVTGHVDRPLIDVDLDLVRVRMGMMAGVLDHLVRGLLHGKLLASLLVSCYIAS
jgi:hypothetical protein